MKRSEALKILKKETDNYLGNKLDINELNYILITIEEIIGMLPPNLTTNEWDPEDNE